MHIFQNLWINLQNKHNSLLSNMPGVLGWDEDSGDVYNNSFMHIWINDIDAAKNVPNSLFGLPVKVFFVRETYRNKEEKLIKTTKLVLWQKIAYGIMDFLAKHDF